MTPAVTPQEGLKRVTRTLGALNVPTAQRRENIQSAIRRGLPQLRVHQPNTERVCLVGSGPSLEHTIDELRELVWSGCKLVAMNGSYAWLIAHNFKPSAMVVLDARPFNARFLTQPVTDCQYFVASQCAPEMFDAVKDWPNVTLWHCFTGDDVDEKALLDGYYMNYWQPVGGGSTVALRSLVLLRMLGFQRFHLFGVDSCYLDDQGHAVPQPENDHDDRAGIYCAGRRFTCASWHVAQALEFVDMVAANGEFFQVSVHGDGLLAHIVRVGATEELTDELKSHAPTGAEGA